MSLCSKAARARSALPLASLAIAFLQSPCWVTARGTKHLNELMNMVREGHRAVILFLVNRGDCTSMSPAAMAVSLYAQSLAEAIDNGVEAMAYRVTHTITGYTVKKKLPVKLSLSLLQK